jgi:arsenate reductase-like glutaredoxin family protein
VVYKQEVSANNTKLGAEDALCLSREVSKIVVAKGKKIVTFDMKKDPPGDDALLAALLGPTGNLRAPTVRKGMTLLVGFDEEMYRRVFE